MENDDYVTKLGWTMEDIARECRNLLHQLASHNPAPAWEGIPANRREKWLEFVEKIVDTCDRRLETTWSQLTQRATSSMLRWETTPEPFRCAWVAVTRHAVNIIMCEDDEDLQDLKGAVKFWRGKVLEDIENARYRDEGHGTGHEEPAEEAI